MTTDSDIAQASARFRQFIRSCAADACRFKLTPEAEPSVYATCFAVFGLHLIRDAGALSAMRDKAVAHLQNAVRVERQRAGAEADRKPYRQLLAFVLSALSILDALDEDPLHELVVEQIPPDVESFLRGSGALDGTPQSGNQAMFAAIFLLHAQRHLGLDTRSAIERWVALHLERMNRFGFWGSDAGMTHLAFQNGFHQYEILQYLGVRNPREREAIAAVRGLADQDGHFAPYPGGGGCYDYDAVFVLTPDGRELDERTARVLERTRATILAEQTSEGGFAESHCVRPRSFQNFMNAARHTAAAWARWPLFTERLRYNVALQRPKHDRIHTHWSRYSRRWEEPNLWDSWFRMLTVARIEATFQPARAGHWGFVDYPGIGFHRSL